MAYQKIVKKVPVEKRGKFSDKLVDLVLKAKKEDKMSGSLAKTLLQQWQLDSLLTTEAGLATLLEAAVLLESEKTVEVLEQELQLLDVAKAIKETK